VGQGIGIAGAGVGRKEFVTIITNIDKGRSTIELAALAINSVNAAVVFHDDTQAIQTALNMAQNGQGAALAFPKGAYGISGSLSVYSNTQLFGADARIIMRDGTAIAAIAITPDSIPETAYS
jgi:polygalacturonase